MERKQRTRTILAASLAIAAPAVALHAQSTQALIVGTVTDQSGAAVPNATVARKAPAPSIDRMIAAS